MPDMALRNAANDASWEAHAVANATKDAHVKKLARAVEDLADAIKASASR